MAKKDVMTVYKVDAKNREFDKTLMLSKAWRTKDGFICAIDHNWNKELEVWEAPHLDLFKKEVVEAYNNGTLNYTHFYQHSTNKSA